MKKLLIGLLVLGSFSVFSSEIVNKRTGERLIANCENFDEVNQACREYSILLEKDGSESLISKYHVKTIDNPDEHFLLGEKLKKLKYFPVTGAILGRNHSVADYRSSGGPNFVRHEDGIIDDKPLLVLAPSAITGAVVVSLLPGTSASAMGIAVIAGAGAGIIFLPFIVPPALDIISLPVRALVKDLQIRKANKNEIQGVAMLNVLTDPAQNPYELSNRKFKSLVKTLKTINNPVN